MMVGSIAAGYWIAHAAFWLLAAFGASEIGPKRIAWFIGLWIIGYAGSGWFQQGAMLFVSYVAVLDIALVLLIFKGDVRLT
jgi:hypothetical protein